MRVVAAIPLAGLLAGCAIGLHLPMVPMWCGLALVLSAPGAAAWAMRTQRPLTLLTVVVAGFCGGGLVLVERAWDEAWRPSLLVTFESIARHARSHAPGTDAPLSADEGAAVVVEGVLRSDAAMTTDGVVVLDIAARWIGRPAATRGLGSAAANPVQGGLRVSVAGSLTGERMAAWRAGRTVRIAARLRRPSRYLNPGVSDQEQALARRGINLVGTVKSAALVEVLTRGSAPSEAAAALRDRIRRIIREQVGFWGSRSASIVTAILIGDRTGLDGDVVRRLQEAGTYHVIAISGGNIALIVGLVLGALRLAGLFGRGPMLGAMVGLLGYGYLVEGGASVDRATLMASSYLVGRAIDLRGSALNSLAVVTGLLVLADPLVIADPGWLLTCGATAAILLMPPAWTGPVMPRLVRWAVSASLASVAVDVVLLPVTSTLFSRVTWAGPVLNLAAIPLMTVAQVAGMFVVLVSVLSTSLAVPVGWLAHLGAEGLVRTSELVAFAPGLTWRLAPPSWAAIATYYAGLVLTWWLWPGTDQERRPTPSGRIARFAAGGVLGVAAVWILEQPWARVASQGNGRLCVTFLDVGQGDAVFVRFPRGRTLLVDAGGLPGRGGFDLGDRVVAPVLRHAGVRRLDTVAVTHGDADHIGGAPSVLTQFRPWEVWEGIPVPPFGPLQALRDTAREVGSRWVQLQRGDQMWIDDVRVSVWHPGRPDWERQRVRNDDSVVLELRWGDASFLLTGDIGLGVEAELGVHLTPAALRVVKVPHHGSRTSSSAAFVEAAKARLTVVSVGRGNPFGHPDPAVLERYTLAGADVLRTDRDGAIEIETDGRTLSVHTFMGRRLTLEARAGKPLREGT